MLLIVDGVVPSILAIVPQLCCSVWRTITYAQISKKVLGMMGGELNQGPCECKAKMLTNELSHTLTWITFIN